METKNVEENGSPFLRGFLTRLAYHILTGKYLEPALAIQGEIKDARADLEIQPDDTRAYLFLGRTLWEHPENVCYAGQFQTRVALEPWMTGRDILKELIGEDDPQPGAYQMLFVPAGSDGADINHHLLVAGNLVNLPEILEEKLGILPGQPLGRQRMEVKPSELDLF